MNYSKELIVFILFAVSMFAGTFIGSMAAAYVPALGNPVVAATVSGAITVFPAYLIWVKVVTRKVKVAKQ